MAKCSYCGDGIALPYTCSLCGDKHCGKHRLAENHECININAYRTPEYAKKKISKSREMQQVKAGNDPASGQSMMQASPRLGNFWTAGSRTQTVLIGGLLLGIIANLHESFIDRPALINSFLDGLAFLGLTTVIGALGMFIVYQFRVAKAQEVGVFTNFIIWPVGIAISLITSLIGFTIYAFGFFSNDGGSIDGQAEVAKNTIYSFAGMFLSLIIFNIMFRAFFPGILPSLVLLALSASAFMFLIFGLIMMIPWGMLDGSKLYNANSREYWIHLAGMIVLLILAFIL